MKFPEIAVTWANVNVTHTPDFVIDRPMGSGDFLFLCYTTPIHLRDRHGTTLRPAEGCVLYSPGAYQWYSGVDQSFSHHWLHFHGRDNRILRNYLRGLHLPLDEYFVPRDISFLVPLISQIKAELHFMDDHYPDVIRLLLHQIILQLSRSLKQKDISPKRQSLLVDKLRMVRHDVHEHLSEKWSVTHMARKAGLSASRFSVLYQHFFNTSPMEDLIVARLKHARRLLTNQALSIKEVAAQSGFDNIHYFSRLFRSRIGCAPRDYYKVSAEKA
ncbi:helix-turn-helix transcriptional regulator [Kamptonema cortianum]|nr:helix-turn-helix transcriptional regulator [Kamptonema cortianum]